MVHDLSGPVFPVISSKEPSSQTPKYDKPQLVKSAKQRPQDPCSGPSTNSTSYRKCVTFLSY